VKNKKKGPEARKQTGPKQAAEATRLLKSKTKELESQEAKLLLAFAETQPAADLTEPTIDMVWRFLVWLRKNDFIILDAKRMVKLSLKLE